MAPSDEGELMHMVATAAAYDDGPSAFRYPRGEGLGVELPERGNISARAVSCAKARRSRSSRSARGSPTR